MSYIVCVKQTDDRVLDEEWAFMAFGSEHTNGPQEDVPPIDVYSDCIEIKFNTQSGLYYALGYLDRNNISYEMNQTAENVADRFDVLSWDIPYRRETCNKIYVAPVKPSFYRLMGRVLWNRMNLRGDMSSVCVKRQGRFAFVSFETYQSMWYVIGYFAKDLHFIVRLKQ